MEDMKSYVILGMTCFVSIAAIALAILALVRNNTARAMAAWVNDNIEERLDSIPAKTKSVTEWVLGSATAAIREELLEEIRLQVRESIEEISLGISATSLPLDSANSLPPFPSTFQLEDGEETPIEAIPPPSREWIALDLE